jgi:glycosyltransferase involved in cell wall biosynthesis
MSAFTLKYSVIVLLEEPEDGFHAYIETLRNVFKNRNESFEIVIVANGTEGFLRNELTKLRDNGDLIKAFAFNKKTTQAVCLNAGFKETKGRIIMVCGSYQQITEDSFTKLLNELDDSTNIISPYRQNRVDPALNQIQSRFFNWLASLATGTKLNDLSCTVKIFRREVLENVELYGNMYRFLPILAERRGFKTKEVKCEHFREHVTAGVYGIYEYLSRIVDLFIIYFNVRFAWKPLRFFSAVGSIFIIIGLAILIHVFSQKVFSGIPLGERRELLLGLLFAVWGVQAASVGLLGEIITFNHSRVRHDFTIEKIT